MKLAAEHAGAQHGQTPLWSRRCPRPRGARRGRSQRAAPRGGGIRLPSFTRDRNSSMALALLLRWWAAAALQVRRWFMWACENGSSQFSYLRGAAQAQDNVAEGSAPLG